MAANMHSPWPKQKPLNAAKQLLHLRALYPDGMAQIIRTKLLWRNIFRPSAFSREYRVQIEYQCGEWPRTRVLSPSLRALAEKRKIPHIYPLPGDPLCLFYSHAREWNPSMVIAKTIVPWACEWLLHFEAWLFTDVWEGGGIHI